MNRSWYCYFCQCKFIIDQSLNDALITLKKSKRYSNWFKGTAHVHFNDNLFTSNQSLTNWWVDRLIPKRSLLDCTNEKKASDISDNFDGQQRCCSNNKLHRFPLVFAMLQFWAQFLNVRSTFIKIELCSGMSKWFMLRLKCGTIPYRLPYLTYFDVFCDYRMSAIVCLLWLPFIWFHCQSWKAIYVKRATDKIIWIQRGAARTVAVANDVMFRFISSQLCYFNYTLDWIFAHFSVLFHLVELSKRLSLH